MKPIESVNDFVIKFANVNGSGSASANTLFAKSILRMGVPVSPRNIFPSNIQGLPTWYEVRVSERGWLGRRGGCDFMVAMNPQTWEKDLAEIEPGGYLFYDSTKPMPPSRFRDDVTVIGMPLTEICNATYADPRQRQLFKNIIYVGALSVLLDIEPAEVERLIGEQYQGKEKLLASNVKALQLGRDYAKEHLERVPLVAVARVARTWSLYRPLDMVSFNEGEGREPWVTRLGLAAFYPTLAAAVAGGAGSTTTRATMDATSRKAVNSSTKRSLMASRTSLPAIVRIGPMTLCIVVSLGHVHARH
mgnify:CR=1 FL=1